MHFTFHRLLAAVPRHECVLTLERVFIVVRKFACSFEGSRRFLALKCLDTIVLAKSNHQVVALEIFVAHARASRLLMPIQPSFFEACSFVRDKGKYRYFGIMHHSMNLSGHCLSRQCNAILEHQASDEQQYNTSLMATDQYGWTFKIIAPILPNNTL